MFETGLDGRLVDAVLASSPAFAGPTSRALPYCLRMEQLCLDTSGEQVYHYVVPKRIGRSRLEAIQPRKVRAPQSAVLDNIQAG